MNIHVKRNEKIVEWDVGKRVITIHNEYILYAFKHGKNMLMIKEKYKASESGFTTYDTEGNIIFSYKYLGNSIAFRGVDIARINERIISVDYEEEKRMLVILKEADEIKSLLIYDENGHFLVEIREPNGYAFISIKNNAGNIMVTARGTNDITRDLFGRNDWNFAIDFNNFYIEKKAITQ